MANRAQKNRLRHGYHTKMVDSGEKATYTTDRPTYVSHKSKDGKPRSNNYASVGEVQWEPPKIGRLMDGKRQWKPRHIHEEPKKKMEKAA